MQIKQLFDDDQAVSPVIGVILMVAITVILAAVIGTFVLGLGDQVQDTAPQASFQFDQSGSGSSAEVDVTHGGGDSIPSSELTVQVEGSDAANQFSGTVSAGSTVTVQSSDISGSGDQIRVVWTASSGDSSATLGSYTVA